MNAANVARQAADIILVESGLRILHRGILEGRRASGNMMKYLLMGTSSNFGNMFSMAGAALILPFLPMLPIQVMLNNLLYDMSQIAVPFDSVDPEQAERPVHWDIGLITRFITVIGPVSSLFDLLTFWLLGHVLGAAPAQFQSGWFIESLATQVLAVFVIRTRGAAWRGRPHPALAVAAAGVIAIAAAVPFTPLGGLFGLVPLPGPFYAALAGMTLAYLLLLELAKRGFYRWGRPPRRRPRLRPA